MFKNSLIKNSKRLCSNSLAAMEAKKFNLTLGTSFIFSLCDQVIISYATIYLINILSLSSMTEILLLELHGLDFKTKPMTLKTLLLKNLC
jgi:hypothetical protein